jgi:homotetrameric cytidine deaminase
VSGPAHRLTAVQVATLVRAARVARRQAYAPYSRFPVGAAVLTASGAVVAGCNVENASYGLSNCAERVAIQRAVSEGHRRLWAVGVVARGDGAMPCGACRQVMREFGVEHVIVAGPSGASRRFRLGDLLDHAFGPRR